MKVYSFIHGQLCTVAEILARYGKTYGWELKSRLMGCRDREVSFKTLGRSVVMLYGIYSLFV